MILEIIIVAVSVVFWIRFNKALTAIGECEKHLRTIAWEAQKAGHNSNSENQG